jgi:hypothetical protein
MRNILSVFLLLFAFKVFCQTPVELRYESDGTPYFESHMTFLNASDSILYRIAVDHMQKTFKNRANTTFTDKSNEFYKNYIVSTSFKLDDDALIVDADMDINVSNGLVAYFVYYRYSPKNKYSPLEYFSDASSYKIDDLRKDMSDIVMIFSSVFFEEIKQKTP